MESSKDACFQFVADIYVGGLTMVQKTVANVFKLIILTIIIGTLYTLSIMAIDLFATTQRLQEVGDYLSRDIAVHNCLLYQPYKYAAEELVAISSKSEYLRTYQNQYTTGGTGGSTYTAVAEDNSSSAENIKTSSKRGITVTTYRQAQLDNTTLNDQRYVQMSETATSLVVPANTAADTLRSTITGKQLQSTGGVYGVAQYGDVLVLRINAVFEPKMLHSMSTTGKTTVKDMELAVWGRIPVSFTYQIPCLSYIK